MIASFEDRDMVQLLEMQFRCPSKITELLRLCQKLIQKREVNVKLRGILFPTNGVSAGLSQNPIPLGNWTPKITGNVKTKTIRVEFCENQRKRLP